VIVIVKKLSYFIFFKKDIIKEKKHIVNII